MDLKKWLTFTCLAWLLAEGNLFGESSLFDQFQERIHSVVAVEFFVQYETDREPREGVGLVVDAEGLVVLNSEVVPGWVPPDQFKEFKVFIPGEDNEGYDATYLGQDYLTGWHYVRAEEGVREHLKPIQEFPTADLELGEPLWGIHLLTSEYNYEPALLRSYLGLLREIPEEMGFTAEDIGVSGTAVFNFQGEFAGWASSGIPEDKIMFMGRETFNVALQSVRGTTVFLTADDFFEDLGRIPESPEGDPRPWIGIAGMEPLDKAVSEIMGLEDQGAIVISDVIEGGPAAEAGLLGRDIVVAVDGEKLPKLIPSNIIVREFEDRLRQREPGDTVSLTVRRGGDSESKTLTITMVEAPTSLRQARREYFEPLGMTIREFTIFDGISRRVMALEYKGVIAQFVRQNSPAASVGLQPGDWIQEIDGTVIETYEQAVEILEGIVADETREEFVLLINRNNETQVLRVKIN